MSVRFLADENFDRAIITGVRRAFPDADIVLVQDVGLRTLADPVILEWAARERCVLLTHDAATIPDYAHARLAAALPMAGVLVARATQPVGAVIADLVLIAQASDNTEWEGRVSYLPLR